MHQSASYTSKSAPRSPSITPINAIVDDCSITIITGCTIHELMKAIELNGYSGPLPSTTLFYLKLWPVSKKVALSV